MPSPQVSSGKATLKCSETAFNFYDGARGRAHWPTLASSRIRARRRDSLITAFQFVMSCGTPFAGFAAYARTMNAVLPSNVTRASEDASWPMKKNRRNPADKPITQSGPRAFQNHPNARQS
ncbi:hypothetical protein FHX57_006483 [Paraburkholderia tropica]|uniref:hypothetical protein n=1 Tax=Paraburkholderia tropica TaxID=92647 RepID=UPI000B087D35|nr:hypothetical protein [Paraburkholderia tropica]MBB3004104.1 hypothetical protein [Paraburkholderia tropica]MBB6323073.1 hypothetical protein [Paraburkholderia tropica]